MKCPFCEHVDTNIQIHCITYHPDEAPISFLMQDRTLEEVINTYKYFLFLTALFSKSPLHQTMFNDMMTYLYQGKTLEESVLDTVEEWKHEIVELYDMDYT